MSSPQYLMDSSSRSFQRFTACVVFSVTVLLLHYLGNCLSLSISPRRSCLSAPLKIVQGPIICVVHVHSFVIRLYKSRRSQAPPAAGGLPNHRSTQNFAEPSAEDSERRYY